MIIAIDSGSGGGFAWSDGRTIQAMEMPRMKKVRNGVIQLTKKGNPKYEVDEQAIYDFLSKQLFSHPDLRIIIEHQQAWFGDSEDKKQFRMQVLLNNYNATMTMIKILRIPVTTVVARTWQKKIQTNTERLYRKETVSQTDSNEEVCSIKANSQNRRRLADFGTRYFDKWIKLLNIVSQFVLSGSIQ